jgi:hypothetical protein
MRRRPWLALVLAPLVLAVALAATGCGGDVVSLDPVAKAADTTTGRGSFRFSFTAADGSGAHGLKGDGAYDAAGERLRMTFSTPGPSGEPTSIDVVADGSDGAVLYLRVPLIATFLPNGKQWIKLDLGTAAAAAGVDLGRAVQAGSASPAELLRALLSSDGARKVARETVGGVETTHYRTTVDPKRTLPARVQGEARTRLEQALERAGAQALPVDVWVGDDGLVRRLRFEAPRIAAGGTSVGGGTFTEELSGYGEPVEVALPPADEVLDASRRLGG